MEYETELQRRVDVVINEMTDYLTDWDDETYPQSIDELIDRWQRILLQIDDYDYYSQELDDLLRKDENDG